MMSGEWSERVLEHEGEEIGDTWTQIATLILNVKKEGKGKKADHVLRRAEQGSRINSVIIRRPIIQVSKSQVHKQSSNQQEIMGNEQAWITLGSIFHILASALSLITLVCFPSKFVLFSRREIKAESSGEKPIASSDHLS